MNQAARKNLDGRSVKKVDPGDCPIMYKGSVVTAETVPPRKTFDLALAYALSVGRQEDLAKACRVRQSTVSRWLKGKGPTSGRLFSYQRKLARFIDRRSRGSA